jgi:hypothetical protein
MNDGVIHDEHPTPVDTEAARRLPREFLRVPPGEPVGLR